MAAPQVGTPRGATSADIYKFGQFELAARRRELFAEGVPVVLGQRAIEILLVLVARHGQLVTKQELMDEIWPNVVVEENNLQVHISALRKALGDDKGERRYLLTVAGRGYRFIAPVQQGDGAADTSSPASSVAASRANTVTTNLPQPLGQLIGRQRDLDVVERNLASHRLVTLIGPGGVGKTRLALEAGTRCLFPDGVWLAELAPIGDAKLVIAVIAEALSTIAPSQLGTLQSLGAALKNKQALLIVDNCEHVIGEAARVIETLIRSCPDLRVLASSRERLAIAGECVFNVAPLDVPEATATSASPAREFSAVRLFVERASALINGFLMNEDDAAIVSAICRRLDGLPLAIELAAPRLKVMTLRQLLAGLEERFRLLTGGSRTAPARHQTLHALIDWSYELLDGSEQEILQRMSVFAGPATLPAIAAVVGNEGGEAELLDLLTSLVEKSLLVANVGGHEPRYRLLESTRYHAFGKLGGNQRHTQERHAQYFASRMAAATISWETTDTQAWLAEYSDDVDQVRSALEWSFGPDRDSAIGLELVGVSHLLWSELGLVLEHRHWVASALDRLNADTPARLRARVLSWQAGDIKDVDDASDCDDALEAAEIHARLGDRFAQGQMLLRAGSVCMATKPDQTGEQLLLQARELLSPYGKTKSLARCLSAQASARMFAGDMASAQALHRQALDMIK
jgi:predicted ATPase/DNA-binding winged helix-turn-helix (wHTH) protein